MSFNLSTTLLLTPEIRKEDKSILFLAYIEKEFPFNINLPTRIVIKMLDFKSLFLVLRKKSIHFELT